jgi:TerC family integral membrane protein
MTIRAWLWVAFHVVVVGGLVIDLGLLARRGAGPTVRQAMGRTAAWVALALAFAGVIAASMGRGPALAFLTGYVTEEALSADNLVVIVLIFSYLGTPPARQPGVLTWGIVGAIVMRGLFIVAGAAALARFAWVGYVLGAVVLASGLRLAVRGDGLQSADAVGRSPMLRALRRVLPFTTRYDGVRLVTREDGRRVGTPLLLALLLVEAMDLVFAVDSIPAIFGITRDPMLVYTSNVFAVIGLRSLYVLIARAADRLRYLTHGVAIVLVFIGAKMLLAGVVSVSTGVSLAVVAAVLGAAVAASLLFPR